MKSLYQNELKRVSKGIETAKRINSVIGIKKVDKFLNKAGSIIDTAGNVIQTIDRISDLAPKILNAGDTFNELPGALSSSIGESISGAVSGLAGAVGSIGSVLGNGRSTLPGGETNQEKLYHCKYKVKTFVIMKGEEKIKVDHSNILNIEYLNDYELNIMAMLKVSLRIDMRKRLWILKNKNEIIVKFELVKMGIDMEDESEIISEETVWNEEFTPYFSDDYDYTDIQSLEKRIETNDTDTSLEDIENENYYETQNLFDIYLFQSKLLKASRYSFNRIYTRNTLQNMVAEMLTESKHEKVLMSKFDNEEVYIEMLLHANPIFKCLVYLDQYYGYYEKGALIFYDVDALYILKTDGKVTAKREEEWTQTNFIVKELTNSQPGQGMIRKEGEKVFYPTISENEIQPQKISDAKNIELGDNTSVVHVDDISVERKEGELAPKNTNKNELVRLIKKGTKYTSTIIQTRVDENNCIMHINGENFDINAFTPNKTYNITFKETMKQEKYGKNKYRLSYAYHYLKLQSTDLMQSSHKIILKKTESSGNN